MHRSIISLFAALVFGSAAMPFATAAPSSEAVGAAIRATDWIVASQKPSGAFFDSKTPADGVAEAVAALVSANGDRRAIEQALGYIAVEGPPRTSDAGWTGRLIAGIAASGHDASRFGGFDYVAKLFTFYDPSTGAFDPRIYADALAIIGVTAAGQPVASKAIEYLRLNQCPSGGYFHDPGCAGLPEIDTTAAVISAMRAAGVPASDPHIQRARYFLVTSQNQSGGFGLGPQSATNANSTGLALSAIAALGEDPESDPWDRSGSPVDALLDLQTATGGFKYRADSPDANPYATIQAIPGAMGAAYPVRPLPPPASQGTQLSQARASSLGSHTSARLDRPSDLPEPTTQTASGEPMTANAEEERPWRLARRLASHGSKRPKTLPIAATSVLLGAIGAHLIIKKKGPT